jgi:hypothetical protein|tara:strand:- start:1772 stop:2179 length:408 start_codon:yes stop_codon:yes gene_type:complete
MKTMNKSLNKNTKKEKEPDKNLDKESENNPEIDFSNFLQNYITNDSESENSLISNNEDETNKQNLENFCYSSDSSSDYLPRYSTLTLRTHNYMPPIYVGPIDIEVYRVIYKCLNSRFPKEICEIITDYLSSSVFV